MYCTINKSDVVLISINCVLQSAFESFKHFTDATSANTIERVVASRTFAVVQTTQGNEFSVDRK